MNHTHQTQTKIYVLAMINELNPFLLRQGAKGITNNIIQQARGDIIIFAQGGNIFFLVQGCIPLLDKKEFLPGPTIMEDKKALPNRA